jgi:large subunit ribosomal protein L25
MKHFELKGTVREAGNKAVVKAFRRQGLIPCNLYGPGVNGNILFTVSEKDFRGILNSPASYIVDIVLDNGSKYMTVVHELQFHPVNDNCLHADFLAVTEDKPIAIDVPINITGQSVGVLSGGKFFKLVRKLRVSALEKYLPDQLDVDITNLEIGKQITAGDLKYDNVTILSPKSTIVCVVRSTRQIEAHIAYEEAKEAAEAPQPAAAAATTEAAPAAEAAAPAADAASTESK